MEPRILEVTYAEFDEERRDAIKAAQEAAKFFGRDGFTNDGYTWFYSEALAVCSYECGTRYTRHTNEAEREWALLLKKEPDYHYKGHKPKEVRFIRHATNTACDGICPGTICECFAKVKDSDGKLHFFHGIHEVGDCPWKL